MVGTKHLFTDEQMRQFITNGYVKLKTELSASFHEAVYQKIEKVFEKEGNPGNNILPRVPEIQEVFDQPIIRGAFTSVLGPSYIMHPHRHCHFNRPGSQAQGWHKDSYWGYRKVRHHRPRWAMAFYYPQDVDMDIGPTGIMPGTQYYNGRTNDDTEIHLPLCGEAGTVTIIHYDLWHRASANQSDKNRYMLKFQFIRLDEPTQPSWNNAQHAWTRFDGATPTNRHEALWRHSWNWLSGNGTSNPKRTTNGEVGRLIDALNDENPTTRLTAADALGQFGEAAQDAIPALVNALDDPFEPARVNAAYALGAIGEPAVSSLVASLGHESEGARSSAAYGLSAVGRPAIPALIDALRHEANEVRQGAAYALGEIGSPAAEAAPALSQLITDPSEQVRRNTVEALGTIGAHTATSALVNALKDSDGQVRFSAVLSLARIGEGAEDAASALKGALHDDNRYVRGYAVDALRRIGTPEAEKVMLDHLLMARWCPSTTRESTF